MIEIIYKLRKKLLSNDCKALSAIVLGNVCTPFSKDILFGFQPDLTAIPEDIIVELKYQSHIEEKEGKNPTALQLAMRKRLMAELAFAIYLDYYEKVKDCLDLLPTPYRDNDFLFGRTARELINEIDKAEAKEYKNG